MKDHAIYKGKDLIALGCEEGPGLGKILAIVNAEPHSVEQVKALIDARRPAPVLEQRKEPAPCQFNITADNEIEENNIASVRATMDVVLRTPVVVEGAVMPDACPAGPIGTIPVGGIVAAKDAIIPGMHSADICCSLMATVFDDVKPADVLAAAHKVTHFGPGGRERERAVELSAELEDALNTLPYKRQLNDIARSHMGTQGDGNHFLYVGLLESTGQTVMVTHHGSRGFGARLYQEGLKRAMRWRDKLSPSTKPANAWIPYDSDEGRDYWDALQVVRLWTKENHTCIHDMTSAAIGADVSSRFWNEQIVPLNMAEPILFVQSERNDTNRGFAPHGAGRNMSRTAHKKRMGGRTTEEILQAETAGLDVRFYTGVTDISELPSAYKNAESVVRDMNAFSLANVVDRVMPFGSIMAGGGDRDAPWRKKRKRRDQSRNNERRNKNAQVGR